MRCWPRRGWGWRPSTSRASCTARAPPGVCRRAGPPPPGGGRANAGPRAWGGEPIDVAVLPTDAHRRKRLFLADMDSTMIEQECIDELAGTLGLKDHVAAITERAMRGEIAFEPALRERVALLKDIPVGAVDGL